MHVKPLYEKLNDELDSVLREADSQQELIEPNEEEKKNGWTAETLTNYLAECRAGQTLSTDVHSLHRRQARKPNTQNHRYRVHRWRE